jgi:cell division septation protein DedD
MPNDLYYDLSGATNLQKDYVNDLSSIYNKNTDNAADIAVQLNNIQSAISQLSSRYDAANSSSDSVLHHQQEMMKILQIEQQRLLDKKAIFDQVESENDRKVVLNTTYRKKYTQYTKITIVVVMVLLGIVILRWMGKYLTIFPESLYSVLMIIIISIGIIYVMILYADVALRSSIDYDQIEIPPPKLDASGNIVANSPAGKSIWSAFDTCSGSKCCSAGTSWSDQLSLCVVQPYNQITTPTPTPIGTSTPLTTAPIATTKPATTAPTKPATTVPTKPATTAPTPTATTKTANAAFTTFEQAVAYGDIDKNSNILPSNIKLNNAWMGDTSNAKPNTYLNFNQFEKI